MKKKILIISIITIILLTIITIIVYKTSQMKTANIATTNDINTEEKLEKKTEENNLETKEENLEETEDKDIENTNEKEKLEAKEETAIQIAQETKEKDSQMATKQSTNEKIKVEQPKTNNQDNAKSNIQQTPINTKEETKDPEPKKEIKKIDLSKYSRYENALNGGYKAYIKSDSEMNKLKGLIDTCIKEFGYTNVKVIPSSSIVGSTQSFTANKTNVENKVFNSEDFTIYYYAEVEYHITAEGTETIFQYRSYIKVQ